MDSRTWNFILFGGAGCVGIIALALGIAWPSIFGAILKQQLHLTPKSKMFSEWADSPVPIYMDIYMWNLTNSEDFAKDPKNVTPDFEEIGPFIFKITTERADVHWNNNGTVTFSPKRTWTFMSNESLDMSLSITTINPLPAVISYFARKWNSPFFVVLVNEEINLRENFLSTATVEEWLFKGIKDELFDLIIPFRNVTNLPIPFDKFAWFAGRNASTTVEGSFTLDTGAHNIYEMGDIRLWNGANHTGMYDGACGDVAGSTGELFHPTEKHENPPSVSLFISDVCSQLKLNYKEKTEVAGVSGYLYEGDDMLFDNGTKYSEMECFCSGECVPSGVRNVSTCKFNAPAFVSYPHFYLADPSYTKDINGMNPDRSKHNLSFAFEPTLGIPLLVRASVQVNLMTWQFDQFDMYRNVPRLFIPILWLSERATLSDDLGKLFKMILSLKTIMYFVLYGIFIISVVICVARIVWLIWRK